MRIVIVILMMLVATPSLSWAATDPVSQVNKKIILHTVQKGETLSSILKSYNLSLDRFLKANRQMEGTNLTLSLGQQLVINKKDIGSGIDSEIAHDIKIYLESRGMKSGTTEETVPVKTGQKAELIRELNTVSKYKEPTPTQKVLPWSDAIKLTMLLPLTK
ncbi:MAG: LysM domain-containing protein, partial [Rikenellaceae bacterium]